MRQDTGKVTDSYFKANTLGAKVQEIYLMGVAASFLMAILNKIVVDIFNKVCGVYVYFENLRKVLPYSGDGDSFLVRYLKLLSIAFIVSLTSWIGFLIFAYLAIQGVISAFNVKGQFFSEESKKYAMPLLNNPDLSKERAYAFKSMIDIANGFDYSQMGEAIYDREVEINKIFKKRDHLSSGYRFDGSKAIRVLEEFDFFDKDTISRISSDYRDYADKN